MRQSWGLILSGSFLLLAGLGGRNPQVPGATQEIGCAQCHTMASHRSSWEKGNHAKAAVCVDCHLPHGPLLRRTQAMAADGLRHAAIEGLHPTPDSLRIRATGAQVVHANCLRCHPRRPPSPSDASSKAKPVPMTSAHADSTLACAQCHRETSHPR